MALRKWIVRAVVFTIFGGVGLAALLYQQWTNPEAVRQAVVDKLTSQVPGAAISLDSARLRLLGGISVSELKLARLDDATKTIFAHVPSAVIYHDKEQLIDGKLAIRKVELYHPQLRLTRLPNGRWNLGGIFGESDPSVPVPTIVIQQGTVLIEDLKNSPGRPPIEIKDLNLTLLNDPLPQIIFKGRGKTDLSGPVQVQGVLQRQDSAFTLSIEAPRVPVKSKFFASFADRLPKLYEHTRHLEGWGAVSAWVQYQPEAAQPWTHDVRLRLHEGKLTHPQVPMPLEHLEASLHCHNGVIRLEKLSADAGPTRISLTGGARVPDSIRKKPRRERLEAITPPPGEFVPADIDVDGELVVTNLIVDWDLFKRLPMKLRKFKERYAPSGPINLTYRFACEGGLWQHHYFLQPLGMTISFDRFRYPVEHLAGTIVQDIDQAKHEDITRLDLTGLASGQKVSCKGTVIGEGSEPAVDIVIRGQNLPIDGKLREALPLQHKPLVKLAGDEHRSAKPQAGQVRGADIPVCHRAGDSMADRNVCPTTSKPVPAFLISGKVNYEVFVRRQENAPGYDNRYIVLFHDCTVRYDVFPYPLENVSGILDVQEDHWEFREFRGTHKGGEFRASGVSRPTPAGDHIDVEIHGGNVMLDSELASAMDHDLQKTWKTFAPSGRMNFRARVDCVGSQTPDVDVTVTALGCNIYPGFFPYTLTDLTGTFRYAKRRVDLQSLRARHGPTTLTIDSGYALIDPKGGYFVDLIHLRGSPIYLDEDLLRALPKTFGDACRETQLKDPFTMRTHLTLKQGPDERQLPTIYWDGEVGMQKANLYVGIPMEQVSGTVACRGQYFGERLDRIKGNLTLAEATVYKQPFKAIHSEFEVPPDGVPEPGKPPGPRKLVLRGVQSKIYGGEIGGPVRVEFGPTLKYEVKLSGAVKLEEFSRQNLSADTPVSGDAELQLYLTGEGSDIRTLRGRGSVDIPKGKLYNLPVLLDLLKFLSLRPPDGTLFEEARADCIIAGERVRITNMGLYGNTISLRGQGDMKLDGTGIDLEFYAVWARILEYLPPIIKELPRALSQHLLKIRLRGELGKVKCTKEPLPDIVEPFKELIQNMRKRRTEWEVR